MAVYNGAHGTLLIGGGVAEPCQNWDLTMQAVLAAYTANDTGGRRRRTVGVGDCEGTFEMLADDTIAPPLDEGDEATVQFHLDGRAAGGGANYIEAEIIIDNVKMRIEVGPDGNNEVWVYSFNGQGTLTKYGQAITSSPSGSSSGAP